MLKRSPVPPPERTLVLLRGINVGGRHIVPMAALRALLAELGCTGTATYIQSGNAVCTAPAALTASMLADALGERFGFAIPVAMRSLAALDAAIAANPFATENPIEHLQIVFVEQPLLPPQLAALQAARVREEQLAVHDLELFLLLPHGVGRSKLAAACGTRLPTATMRNWKTVLQLRAMLAG